MANWLANGIDWAGTALNLPEFGISELFNGANSTANTGNRGGNHKLAPNSYNFALQDQQKLASARAKDKQNWVKIGPEDSSTGTGDGNDAGNDAQIWNPGTGGASSGPSAAEIQQQRFYQALLDSLGGRKQTASAGIDEKYNQGLGKIGTQRDIAFSNLDREDSKLGDQRKKALGQIQADTQNILQGANTTLGMYGAGNSSAADMAAFGAADLANKSNADATDQYNEQMGDISLSHRNTKREYDEEKNELDQWKRDQSRKLNDDFTNLENDFRGKIGGQANLDAVIRSFQDMRNPDVKVGTLADYKSDNISTQDLNGSVSTPTLTQDQAAKYLTPQNQRKKKDDTDINSGYLL